MSNNKKNKPEEIVDDSGGLSLNEKIKAFEKIKASFSKKYSVDFGIEPVKDYIPTGSAVLDYIVDNGGWATGRIHEISGQNSSGKSTLVTLTCKNALEKFPDKFVLYIDAECALNVDYAMSLGLDMMHDERVHIVQEQGASTALQMIEDCAKSGMISLIILDSLPALYTKREEEAEHGKDLMAEKARILSQSLGKIAGKLKDTDTTLIIVNQVRTDLSQFIPKEKPTGGNAIGFYSSTRVKIKQKKVLLDSEEDAYGQICEFQAFKNKVGIPYRKGESTLVFGEGFDAPTELVTLAVKHGIISQAGAWYKLPEGHGQESCQGLAGTAEYYRENPEEMEKLRFLVNNFGKNKEENDE